MFSPHEPLLRFRRTGGSLTPNGWPWQYVRRGKIGGLFFSLLLLLFSSPALAQSKEIEPSPDLDPEKYKVWKSLHRRAVEALNDGRKIDAISAWKAAHEIKPMYYLACDIGSVELMVGNPAEAAEYLSNCLHTMPNPPSAGDLARKPLLEANLKKAKAQIGTIQLEVLESGAAIHIDGKLKGLSPISDVFVQPGVHSFIIEKNGYRLEERAISIDKGQTQTIIVQLKEMPPKAAEPSMKPAKAKPAEKPAPKPEQAKAKPITKAEESNASNGRRSPTLITTGFGIAGISAGFGTALLIASQDWRATRDEQGEKLGRTDGYNCVNSNNTDYCVSYRSADQKRAQMLNGAIVSYSFAGAIALSTLAYVVIPRKGFEVSIGPHSAMVKIPW